MWACGLLKQAPTSSGFKKCFLLKHTKMSCSRYFASLWYSHAISSSGMSCLLFLWGCNVLNTCYNCPSESIPFILKEALSLWTRLKWLLLHVVCCVTKVARPSMGTIQASSIDFSAAVLTSMSQRSTFHSWHALSQAVVWLCDYGSSGTFMETSCAS